MVKTCYTYQFYITHEETRPSRGTTRKRWVERCRKLNIQLKVAAVAAHGPLGLASITAYDKLAQTTKTCISGSPGRYFDHEGNVQECDHYQLKEPL